MRFVAASITLALSAASAFARSAAVRDWSSTRSTAVRTEFTAAVRSLIRSLLRLVALSMSLVMRSCAAAMSLLTSDTSRASLPMLSANFEVSSPASVLLLLSERLARPSTLSVIFSTASMRSLCSRPSSRRTARWISRSVALSSNDRRLPPGSSAYRGMFHHLALLFVGQAFRRLKLIRPAAAGDAVGFPVFLASRRNRSRTADIRCSAFTGSLGGTYPVHDRAANPRRARTRNRGANSGQNRMLRDHVLNTWQMAEPIEAEPMLHSGAHLRA